MGLRDARLRAAAAVARRLGDPYRVLRFVADQDLGPRPDPSRATLDVRALLHGVLATVKADAGISGRHHIVGEALGRSEVALIPLDAFAGRAEWPAPGDRLQPVDDAGVPLAGEAVFEVVTAEPDRTAQLVVTLTRMP